MQLRSAATAGALVLLVAAVVPPVATLAQRYDFVEACQFAVLGLAVPALVALGAPWMRSPRVERVAAGRLRHPEVLRSLAFLALATGASVAWRTPPLVDALARHRWLLAAEAATLVPAGVGLWLELIESPPLAPRAPRPVRAVLAALAMWALWVTAYAVGFSRSGVYDGFRHVTGGLSAASDQELAAAVVWAAALFAFVPVAFASVVRWLQVGEQPDDEMRRLVREEARRGVLAGAAERSPSSERPPPDAP